MLHIKTKVGKSPLHGIGLFADQFIPKGTVTWEYHPDFDSSFSEADTMRMTESARKQFFHYAYYDKDLDRYVLCFDDQRFINHSTKHENIHSTPRRDVALRDIHRGEELLCDYYKYDDTYFNRLGNHSTLRESRWMQVSRLQRTFTGSARSFFGRTVVYIEGLIKHRAFEYKANRNSKQ